MLERLELENVGPAPDMVLDLQPRLNLITGDNGLGKSFLLDAAWWALTRRWPRDLNPRLTSGYAAASEGYCETGEAAIRADNRCRKQRELRERILCPGRELDRPTWKTVEPRTGHPCTRRRRLLGLGSGPGTTGRRRGRSTFRIGFQGTFSRPEEVWTGLVVPIQGKATKVCKGLLDDWSSWIRENGENARRMAEVVGTLTVRGEPCEVGPILRLSVDDAQDIPSIKTEYSNPVPIVHASSAVRRITGLAYMLTWSWSEHVRAATQLGVKVARAGNSTV